MPIRFALAPRMVNRPWPLADADTSADEDADQVERSQRQRGVGKLIVTLRISWRS
jgi:hypothetical protein